MGPEPGILTFSSQVICGHVGNSAMQFALQKLGFDVFAVPTALLGYHKGHSRKPFEQLTSVEALSNLTADVDAKFTNPAYGAVLSGYTGSAAAVVAIANHIRSAKARDADLVYLCDPVLGDQGRLYVSQDIAAAIRDHLLPLADILTPNLFELGWLTGAPVDSLEQTISAARSLEMSEVLVTSAPSEQPHEMVSLLVTDKQIHIARTTRLPNPPHGTGDLIAALYLGRRQQGYSGQEALGLAAASVHDVLEASARLGLDELALVAAQETLSAPVTQIICETH